MSGVFGAIAAFCCCREDELVACCNPNDGTCSLQTEQDCLDLGHIPQPGVHTCDPNPCDKGACCLDDCTCLGDVTEEQCAQAEGEFQGFTTKCEPGLCDDIGACCLPDESCIETTPSNCSSLNGQFQGCLSQCSDPDVDCSLPPDVFCCDPDNTCNCGSFNVPISGLFQQLASYPALAAECRDNVPGVTLSFTQCGANPCKYCCAGVTDTCCDGDPKDNIVCHGPVGCTPLFNDNRPFSFCGECDAGLTGCVQCDQVPGGGSAWRGTTQTLWPFPTATDGICICQCGCTLTFTSEICQTNEGPYCPQTWSVFSGQCTGP